MRGIGIQPRVPEQGHRELGRGDGQEKTLHSGSQFSGVPFGNTRDHVGGPSEGQCGRKTTDDRDYLPFQPERFQRFSNRSLFIYRSLVETPPRNADVPAGRITRRRDLALTQRVTHPDDADEAVSKQCLRAHFRSRRLHDDAGFQIDRPLAKWPAVFVWLLHEAQPHTGRLFADASKEVWSEVLDKAFAGTQSEGAHQVSEVEILSGA